MATATELTTQLARLGADLTGRLEAATKALEELKDEHKQLAQAHYDFRRQSEVLD